MDITITSAAGPRLGLGLLTLVLGACATQAPIPPDLVVASWVEQNAVAIPADLTEPAPDQIAIAEATAEATVIGLGEPGHAISEVNSLQARYLRHLVENEGVRAVAFEMDWTLALALNDYVLGDRDDVEALLEGHEVIWRTTEMLDTLQWLRDYNSEHDDAVQLAGTEYFATGPVAYDAVESFVAAQAPDRSAELQDLFELLRPTTDDAGAHLQEYMAIEDKQPYVEAAAAVEELITAIGRGDGHDLALHHARQIHSWYEGFSLPWDEIPQYRDARVAENVRWWQHHTGARTVYWAASAHVAVAPTVTITEPGAPDTVMASAGSYLQQWYGADYVTIGFTFDRGTSRTAEGVTVELEPAAPGWFESRLAEIDHQVVLRLDGEPPVAVEAWLDAPLVTRGRPEVPGSEAFGGTLRGWFDVLVHTPVVTPAHPL